MNEKREVVEYRGFRDLVFAEVIQDDADGYKAGPWKPFAPAGDISKTVAQASATKYYDNRAAIVISSKGEDTITLNTAVIPDTVLAEVTGQFIDPDTGVVAEGSSVGAKYFALGYKLGIVGDTTGDDPGKWVTRYKGTFNTPDITSKTIDGSTDSSGQTITFTGVNTNFSFLKGGSAKGYYVPTDSSVDLTDHYAGEVKTIDDLGTASPRSRSGSDYPEATVATVFTSPGKDESDQKSKKD
jgi:phi13 family phage major tail protein